MKKMMILLTVLLLGVANIYAQTSDTGSVPPYGFFTPQTNEDGTNENAAYGQRRSIIVYLDAHSGELNIGDKRNALFQNNDFEFGVVYGQNFAKVPWLDFFMKLNLNLGQQGVYGNNPIGPAAGNAWNGNYGIPHIEKANISPRFQLGLNLGGYSTFAMNTEGLFTQENYYKLDFGRFGAFLFISTLEFWAVPRWRYFDPNFSNGPVHEDKEGVFEESYKYQILSTFALRVDYSIPIVSGWTFYTKFQVRFTDDNSPTLFWESLWLRWDNQLVWNVTSSLWVWTEVRYDVFHLAAQDFRGLGGPLNSVSLRAGIGYYFDVSRL